MCLDRHRRAQRVVRQHDHRAGVDEGRRDEGLVALVERAPVAAVDVDEHRRAGALAAEDVEPLARRAAVGDVERAARGCARAAVRALGPVAQDGRVLRDAGAVVVLRVEPGGRLGRRRAVRSRLRALMRRSLRRASASARADACCRGLPSAAPGSRPASRSAASISASAIHSAIRSTSRSGSAPDVLQDHVRLDAVDDRQRVVQPVADRRPAASAPAARARARGCARDGRAGTAPPRAGRRARAPTARARAAPRRAAAARTP